MKRATRDSSLLQADISYLSVRELKQSRPRSQASSGLGNALNLRHMRNMNRSTSLARSPFGRKHF